MKIKDSFYRLATGLHRAVFRVSRGRFVRRAMGMPVAELVTTGRRSGRARSTMLAVPIVEAGRAVLVGSFGGDDRHPAWFLNLRSHPDVRLTLNGRTRAMRARVATDDERAELWPRVTKVFDGYRAYQDKTERVLPVVVLEEAAR